MFNFDLFSLVDIKNIWGTRHRTPHNNLYKMEKFIKKNPVLLVVDVQKGFLDEKHWGGNRNNKKWRKNC